MELFFFLIVVFYILAQSSAVFESPTFTKVLNGITFFLAAGYVLFVVLIRMGIVR